MTWEDILYGGSAAAGPPVSLETRAERKARERREQRGRRWVIFWHILGSILSLVALGAVIAAAYIAMLIFSVMQGFVVLMAIFVEAAYHFEVLG